MKTILFVLAAFIIVSCQKNKSEIEDESKLVCGRDFLIMKKLEDVGGKYKIDGAVKDGV